MLAKKNVGLNHVDNNVVIDSHSSKGLLRKMKGGIYPLLFFLTSPFKSLNIRIIVDAYRIGKNIDMKIEKLSHIVRKNI